MKKNILFIIISLFFINVNAQTNIPADSGTFFLHKFAQKIGQETYVVHKYKDAIQYSIDFKFVDRGSPVPLTAELKVNPVNDPLELTIKGSTSRFSKVDDKITIHGGEAAIRVDDSSYTQKVLPSSFTVAGYSPGTVQQVLLQYWKKQHEPESIHTLPFGSVQIKKEGTDELSFNGSKLTLDRFTISGLVWGNELLWADSKGNLICLITNDAEGDKLEMMRAQYEALLPQLITKAATYGMQLFAKATGQAAGTADETIAVTGGNLYDVVTGTSIPDAVIIISKGIIVRTGKAGSVSIPAGAKVIDAKGKTILPGLWDMHSHFEQAEWGPAYLAAGVTTVRDCGNEFEYINAIKSAIDNGTGVGPNILKAGIIDGKGPKALGIIQADTKEEAIKAVDRYKENGFAQIKIYSSAKPEIVKVICDEAHRLGLTVTGHIPNGMTLQQGIDSGMNMVNHIQYVYSIMKRNADKSVDFNDPQSLAAIDFIKQHHVVIDPTVGVYELAFRNLKDDITQLEPAFYNLPLPLQALFKNMGEEPEDAIKTKPLLASLKQAVKKLNDAGVPLVAGTDMGFPGNSLARELELYVEAGLTPAQALKTATITPATVMSLDKQSGSIEAGKQADLIIIDGDPIKNIRDIRNVSVVIKGGRVYDPVKLHQMVGFAK